MKSEFEYIGILYRFGAHIIDGIVLGIIFFILGAGITGSPTWSIFGPAAAALTAANGVIVFLYFWILEGTFGTTLGKKALKIKVVKEDGQPCGIGASFIRNILRIIDILPFIYIIGMILIARSDKKQRLGDRAAHTIVIKEGTQRESVPTTAPTPTEETKYCLSCGKKIPSEAVHCPQCGAKQ